VSANGQQRDLVVIGASAGGIEAVSRVLRGLPKDFPSAICLVLHLAPKDHGFLVELLAKHTKLAVRWGEQGAELKPGCVYVAPIDLHMLVFDDHIQLSNGARENHARPSIDKLFRSAAAIHGPCTVGVLLTGMLSDGVAGLAAIQGAGGAVIVHDPDDAKFPDLPTAALTVIKPDRKLPLESIAPALVELTRQPVPRADPPSSLAIEAAIDRGKPTPLNDIGVQTTIACPDCGGPMWQLGDPLPRRYRCYLGHALDAKSMLDATSEKLETALWTAVRVLDDRTRVLETLARDAESRGDHTAAAERNTEARISRERAELIWNFMFERIQPAT